MGRVANFWRVFTAAPHRAMFLGGAVQGVAVMGWWLLDLLGRYGAFYPALQWSVAPIWGHAYLMMYAFFPFFIFGFLFTTYPNWVNGAKIPARYYVSTFLLMAAGAALFYAGLTAAGSLLAAGAALLLAGWGVGLYALLHVLVTAPHKDKRHPAITSVALALGWLCSAAYLGWLLTAAPFLLEVARAGGIWFFLLPIFITVSHRMIPFFSGAALRDYVLVRPYWILWSMLAGSLAHGALQLAGAPGLLWLVDLPLAALALYLSYAWGFRRSFEVRLLAVLHIAFSWLGVALLLYAAQSLALFASGGSLLVLGLSPLHALTIGFFASMVLAMASRVTLGHSGRPLKLDGVTWALFLCFQLVAASRILPDLAGGAGSLGAALYVVAAAVWLACFAPWLAKYAPMYWKKRVDGRPG